MYLACFSRPGDLSSSLVMFPVWSILFSSVHSNETQLAHDVVTTLVFGCLLVATLENVESTLSQHCLSDVAAPAKIWRCYNIVFSTSIFQPDTNVVATSCFWRHFSDKILMVYQRHYDSLLPKSCKWYFNYSFW